MCSDIYIYTRVYICMFTSAYNGCFDLVHIHMHAYIYICIYIYIYIYIEKERDRQREREREGGRGPTKVTALLRGGLQCPNAKRKSGVIYIAVFCSVHISN